jgi:hypothetical protein
VGWGRGRSLLPFLGSASCCASSNALNIQTGDAVLAVDIGGTNIRAGVVQLNLKKSNTLAKAVSRSLHRRVARANISRLSRTGHCSAGLDVKRPDRRGQSKKHLKLAPFVGIGCPGVIEEDGSIDRGAQNLPGNWESSKFNLPLALYEMIPTIGEHETSVGGLVKSHSCRTSHDGVF